MSAMTGTGAYAPAIDVIVPTYRREVLLQRCLAALASQTRNPDRVIVVARADDAASHEVVEGFANRVAGLELVTVEAPGVIAAMSAGVAASAGAIVAFTDDDAAPRPDWIERLLVHFEDPTVGAVGGRDVIPGHEGRPLTDQVGIFQRSGRMVGGHHLGTGPPRDVDVLKGVNMAFRAEALALPAPAVLRGTGAQVDFELLCCAFARRRGWRVVYDPAVLVDHEGAARHGADRRVRPDLSAVFDAAFNSIVAGCALEPGQRLRRAAYGITIGTADRPGLGRALAGLFRGEWEVLRRTGPALAGRLAAMVLLLRRYGGADSAVVVSAAELRDPARKRRRLGGSRRARPRRHGAGLCRAGAALQRAGRVRRRGG